MTGPEHYKEAERLIALAGEMVNGPHLQHAAWVAEAQVHATLALVAATARPAVQEWIGDELRDGADWARVTS
jgi:hypothetical protein